MFSSAFKNFTSNITANYEIAKEPTAIAGAWTIFDAKKRSTTVQASVFVFKRESLEAGSGGFGARVSATSIRKAQDEVVERLKKEASSLARLRHPSILQLVEPVEETRSGGLMFATEPVLASLSGALLKKDVTESVSTSGRSHREDRVSKAFRDVEVDELEVQKGLLQVAKGLEFLHDSAKLVHGNLNPGAIFINAKSDWKISGLAFAGPPDGAEGHQPIPQISLSEVLHNDARVPRCVQLDLDYTSPDFVLDANVTFAADIFSLGLILLACYRKPHVSPIETNGSQSAYKRICSNASTVPNPSNNYLSANALPQELSQTLPRVLARRPAQRMNAAEFQQSQYFDNILVNTMRFLDDLPAKTSAEKSQFMSGLPRVMPQFPASILSKKVLTALLDEMKDRDLLALILQNVFKIIAMIPNGKDVVSDKVLPQMREIFLSKAKTEEVDKSREAGLLIVLENFQVIASNCSAKQFKDDVLPVLHVAMESSTHSLTDAALQKVPLILPLIDFSTVKHDLFPVVANVFAKTSSLSIKVRGLEALGVLCGVQHSQGATGDDFTGGSEPTQMQNKNKSMLDKYTMQEKVVPLLKGIKTKEPAVIMAALKVLRQVGQAADIEFRASEVMPILWTFALGPLLDLSQFKSYMDVIKRLSVKIEVEQTRKLQELGGTRASESRSASTSSTVFANGTPRVNGASGAADDFERLVLGEKTRIRSDPFSEAMSDGQRLTQNPPTFSWSQGSTQASMNKTQPQRPAAPVTTTPFQPASRSITPDVSVSSFPSLQPASSNAGSIWANVSSQSSMQQARPLQSQPLQSPPLQAANYSSGILQPASSSPSRGWPSQTSSTTRQASNAYSSIIAPPPMSNSMTPATQPNDGINTAPRIASVQAQAQAAFQPSPLLPQHQQQSPTRALDKYQSLL